MEDGRESTPEFSKVLRTSPEILKAKFSEGLSRTPLPAGIPHSAAATVRRGRQVALIGAHNNIGVGEDMLREGGGDEVEVENESEEEREGLGDMGVMYVLPGGDDPPGEEQELKLWVCVG
ncbi:hypothetical protein RHS01_00678 [Rhizoctonia solani]|uniref:Uncharacterized protein n=1 Tax=Rhizoctonia solani TaxID=456999 RepID=A0A8H7INH9_9AGAM|nr:hypothetical protein RHS01_00678 [Rhizoctonia solani]